MTIMERIDGARRLVENSESKKKYLEKKIVSMLEFMLDNNRVVLADICFSRQLAYLCDPSNCAPLLTDVFLY